MDRVTVGEHLGAHYGIDIDEIAVMDAGVFRVRRRDGPDWVARVFGPPREPADTEGDAAILRRLEQAGFPAERCAATDPVSILDDTSVLVTEYVPGQPASWRGRTFAVLGALLGRLHARPGTGLRPGGAWHHLVPRGSIADEIAAASVLLEGIGTRIATRDRRGYEQLRALVDSADSGSDLPHSFVHPDPVRATR